MSVRKPSESLNSSIARKTCGQHPDRQATHQLQTKASKPESYYCQKCSIMLASQGYNVIKINMSNPVSLRSHSSLGKNQSSFRHNTVLSQRKTEISSFFEGVEAVLRQLEQKDQAICGYLIKSETEHGRMLEQAAQFYKQIEELVQLQKFTTYNSILNKRSIEQAEARNMKNIVQNTINQIEGMLVDIRQNMDAVESVQYSIYNAIMHGYQNKVRGARDIVYAELRPMQKCTLSLPQIPTSIRTLSDKICISFSRKSNPTTGNNSVNHGFKPTRACTGSQVSENSHTLEIACQQQSYRVPRPNPTTANKEVSSARGHVNQLAFSFDDSSNNSREVIVQSNGCLENSNCRMDGFDEGKLSKISERMYSKEVCESRESLGDYLRFSQSREPNSIEQTETLLIA